MNSKFHKKCTEDVTEYSMTLNSCILLFTHDVKIHVK